MSGRIDARTTEERERDRLLTARRVEQELYAEQERQRSIQRSQELAAQEQTAIAQREMAEAEKLKRKAQIKFAEAMTLSEQNKKVVLDLRTTVSKEEFYYQKNRRSELDRLSDTNWIEQQRHERQIEIEGIKRDLVRLEADARKFEASAGADEIRGLLEALAKLE